jgi:SAM-dependent methyltransferase
MTEQSDALPGVHPAPNIQSDPDVYEIENLAVDPEGLIEAAMQAVAPWPAKIILDLGAGTGFHIARFHVEAAHVIAVEPHGPSRLRAMARAVRAGLANASVMTGSAERILLPDHSEDIAHARFAYCFGPGCEPGLAELARVIRPGGAAFIIDNDLRYGTFAAWLRRAPYWRDQNPAVIEQFWADQGFTRTSIASEWLFINRADLEAVVHLEFPAALAEEILAEHPGTRVEYYYNLYHRRY